MSAFLAHSSSSRRAVLSSLLMLALFPLHAQAQATPEPPAPASASSRGTALPPAAPGSVLPSGVSVDLVVRTKHHQPVLNLDPSQLAVTDGGTPVQLTSLRLVNADAGSQHLVTLVFDRLNPQAAKVARTMAAKVLQAIPEKGYTFAVLQQNGRLCLLQSWTQDRQMVNAAVDEATPATPESPSADMTPAEKSLIASLNSDALSFTAADRSEGKLMLDALEQSQRILDERRNYPSLAALQALVASDRVLSGRKFIFYFSSDTTWNSDARDIVRSIVGLANRAGVTVGIVNTSPFNPEMNSYMEASLASPILGNTVGTGGATAFSGGSGSIGNGGGLNTLAAHYVADYSLGNVDTSQSPLVALAFGTGGIYISDTRQAKHQLRDLHEDLSAWYQASWAPPISDYDGQFRPVQVRPLRKGLVIRARSGYFAVPSSGSSEIHPFEMPLLNLLAGSTLPTDVAFHAGVLHLGQLSEGNAAELVVQVPVSQLQVHQDANTHISSVDAAIVAVIRNSKGDVLQRFGQEFPLHEAPELLRADSGQTLTLERQFSAEPGVYTLEAAVLDRLGNKRGALRTTFTIAPLPQGPSLSDIALVEGIEPAEEDNQTFFEPMRYRDGRVVPNLDPSLPQTTKDLSLFFLVHPLAGTAGQPTLHMQIIRDGRVLTEIPMDLEKVSGTGAALPYLETIHARGFPPGDYQVKALLSQNGDTASSMVSFHVEGTATAGNATSPLLTAAGPEPDRINSKVVSEAATANSMFVISKPANPLPAPAETTVNAMIEGARQRALAWSGTLVDFFCLEVTDHFEDATGEGVWKPKGTLVELMKYVDHDESRTTLQLDGAPSNVEPDRLQFFHSTGEFGAMFHIVFNPAAKAVFSWKRSAFLDGQPVQVFSFRVTRANSSLVLTDRSRHVQQVGFHGLLYLDPATNSVRRISIDADDIPSELLIRACSLSVDYAWVTMENHDFLLPVRGAVSLQETGRRPVLNEFEFRNYHRFGSQVRMLSSEEAKALKK
jgi:VWFA-related protein